MQSELLTPSRTDKQTVENICAKMAAGVSGVGVLRLVCPSSYGDSVVAGFSALQEQKRMTDFTIKTNGGKSIHVHKMLLSVASDYFSAMFESGMKEMRDDEVHLDTLLGEVVFAVVDYFYGREITIKWEQVVDYLDVIEYFQLPHLKSQVENYIIENIAPKNAIHWCQVAAKYGLEILKVKSKAVIASNFVEAVAANFNDLDLSELLDLLRDKALMSVNSDLKLRVVLGWVTEKEEERKEALAELTDNIKLETCSAGYLAYVLENHEALLMSQVAVCVKMSKAMASGLATGKYLAVGKRFVVMQKVELVGEGCKGTSVHIGTGAVIIRFDWISR